MTLRPEGRNQPPKNPFLDLMQFDAAGDQTPVAAFNEVTGSGT